MANEIIPGLWLGDRHAAKDAKFMKYAGINVVINVTKHIPNYFDRNIKYIRIGINDPGPGTLDNEDNIMLLKMLPDLLALINYYKEKGKTIFIHCHSGAQRSCSIVLLYLYKYYYTEGKEKERLYLAMKKILKNRKVAFNYGDYSSFAYAISEYVYNN